MSPEIASMLPVLCAITCVASAIQGASGFGFGLFAVAALSLFVQLKTSTPFLAILNLPVIIFVFWRLRHAVCWPNLRPVILGLLVGIPVGIFVLVKWPEDLLMRALGIVLLLAAFRAFRANSGEQEAEAPGSCPTRLGAAGSVGIGAASGALAGAFNVGGPPVIAWVYCRPWSKEQRTATLQAVFVISSLTRIAIMALPPASLYDLPVVLSALVCMPAAILGSLLGQAMFRRISHRALEIFVYTFLVFIGLKLLIWA